ncbi:hypothetical protein T07_7588, partial [Trichinella nelsoni]
LHTNRMTSTIKGSCVFFKIISPAKWLIQALKCPVTYSTVYTHRYAVNIFIHDNLWICDIIEQQQGIRNNGIYQPMHQLLLV